MGINILSIRATRDFNTSSRVTANHVDKIKEQGTDAPYSNSDCIALIKTENEKIFIYQKKVEEIKRQIPLQVKRCLEMSGERGSSYWLVAFPLKDKALS